MNLQLGDSQIIKTNLIYAPFHTEQEEITMKSAKFPKCAKRSKKFWPSPGLNCEGNYELCDARRHFALDFLTITTH